MSLEPGGSALAGRYNVSTEHRAKLICRRLRRCDEAQPRLRASRAYARSGIGLAASVPDPRPDRSSPLPRADRVFPGNKPAGRAAPRRAPRHRRLEGLLATLVPASPFADE